MVNCLNADERTPVEVTIKCYEPDSCEKIHVVVAESRLKKLRFDAFRIEYDETSGFEYHKSCGYYQTEGLVSGGLRWCRNKHFVNDIQMNLVSAGRKLGISYDITAGSYMLTKEKNEIMDPVYGGAEEVLVPVEEEVIPVIELGKEQESSRSTNLPSTVISEAKNGTDNSTVRVTYVVDQHFRSGNESDEFDSVSPKPKPTNKSFFSNKWLYIAGGALLFTMLVILCITGCMYGAPTEQLNAHSNVPRRV